jgi:hypothetical protein
MCCSSFTNRKKAYFCCVNVRSGCYDEYLVDQYCVFSGASLYPTRLRNKFGIK